MKQPIHIETSIKELFGVGEEWLISEDGMVLAKFIDGNIEKETVGNKEETCDLLSMEDIDTINVLT